MKKYLFPSLDERVERIVHIDSIKNIYHLSLVLGSFELLTLFVFFITTKELNSAAWTSIASVLICILICLAGRMISGMILKSESVSLNHMLLLKVFYCLILSAWAIWVSYRHYLNGDQLLTFYTVELLMVCFITLRPWISIILTVAVYSGLYSVLYYIDGASGINIFNYVALVFASAIGMIVRFQSQVRLAQMADDLEDQNDLLEYANRHDGLTDLLNRKALEEDAQKLVGNHVTAFMVDINYFKEINDTHGHIAGDNVLKETARQLEKLFPESWHYRFGGDEFLVLHTKGDMYAHDYYSFHAPAIPAEKIVLSIGRAESTPESKEQLFELIAEADASLYVSKQKTHTPEFGGHDRRRRKRI